MEIQVWVRHIDDLTGEGQEIGGFSLDEIHGLIEFFKCHKTYFLEYAGDPCVFAGTQFVVGEKPHLEIIVKEPGE